MTEQARTGQAPLECKTKLRDVTTPSRTEDALDALPVLADPLCPLEAEHAFFAAHSTAWMRALSWPGR